MRTRHLPLADRRISEPALDFGAEASEGIFYSRMSVSAPHEFHDDDGKEADPETRHFVEDGSSRPTPDG